MKAKGYMGKILRIDLDTQKIKEEQLIDEWAEKYIGGSGLGARILYDETLPETDPLGPENPLIFAVGPLTGTRIFNSNRFEVIAKSPLTGIYAESNSGGYWGEVFKRTGYDAVVIKGRSERPVYIYINENEIKIEDALHIWGKDTFDVDNFFKEKMGQGAESAVIGPAGENLVKISNIITDGTHGRAAGRCGMGAVMGSKNLKAVVVNGNKEVVVAQEDRIKDFMKKAAPLMKEGVCLSLNQYGTSGGVEFCEEIGNIPIKNWYQGTWEGAKKISGQRMAETILVNRYHCGRCVINCGRVVKAVIGPYKGMEIGGPEYETIGLLGTNCLIDDLTAIVKGNELCNRYGLDPYFAGWFS